jgi:uracil-DNA glycosylase
MASSSETRTMKHPDVREKRRAMLTLPHVAPVAVYASSLRVHGDVPDFDPLDGGINAEVLFLFEKPGPMASGSGFISRDNDDPTVAATMDFMARAGLARKRTVTWNVIPWWNGITKVTPAELRQGTACVRDLLTLLPASRAVVLVGRKAARVHHLLPAEVKVFTSDHPSPKVRAKYPARWNAISGEWARARAFLDA